MIGSLRVQIQSWLTTREKSGKRKMEIIEWPEAVMHLAEKSNDDRKFEGSNTIPVDTKRKQQIKEKGNH
jgi:hypothetical protein